MLFLSWGIYEIPSPLCESHPSHPKLLALSKATLRNLRTQQANWFSLQFRKRLRTWHSHSCLFRKAYWAIRMSIDFWRGHSWLREWGRSQWCWQDRFVCWCRPRSIDDSACRSRRSNEFGIRCERVFCCQDLSSRPWTCLQIFTFPCW